ncbi:hypothetical protein FH972_009352 [Carpinus fangiana]|uniref:Uncharacterized protein n=1 Tax=Carpinus fangiana TaxID=176857 RepID=A0A5N6R379_9ROSI|nr:hypothetical protein FH972_009352 [Carpinus fangiana]
MGPRSSPPHLAQPQKRQQQQSPLFQQLSSTFGFQMTPFSALLPGTFSGVQLITQMAPVAPLPFSH